MLACSMICIVVEGLGSHMPALIPLITSMITGLGVTPLVNYWRLVELYLTVLGVPRALQLLIGCLAKYLVSVLRMMEHRLMELHLLVHISYVVQRCRAGG